MGNLLSTPQIDVISESKKNDRLSVYMTSMQGYRPEMEDAHTIELDIPQLSGWSFIGVFDGHAGQNCSEMASKHIVETLVENEKFMSATKNSDCSDEEITAALQECYVNLDLKFKDRIFDVGGSGSTACSVLLSPTKIYFINLGDSRAILSSSDGGVVFSTSDHKPENNIERERIRGAGGTVSLMRINGTLAVSRAFGDFDYKRNTDLGPEKQMVSPVPEVDGIKREESYTNIVVACDGLWDVFTNDEVSKYIQLCSKVSDNIKNDVDNLMFAALSKNSQDNISIINIQLDKKSNPEPDREIVSNFKSWWNDIKTIINKLIDENLRKHPPDAHIYNISSEAHRITKIIINGLASFMHTDRIGLSEQVSIDDIFAEDEAKSQFARAHTDFCQQYLYPHSFYKEIYNETMFLLSKRQNESSQLNANHQSQNMYSEPNNSSQRSNASENETVDKKIA